MPLPRSTPLFVTITTALALHNFGELKLHAITARRLLISSLRTARDGDFSVIIQRWKELSAILRIERSHQRDLALYDRAKSWDAVFAKRALPQVRGLAILLAKSSLCGFIARINWWLMRPFS